MRNYKLNFVSPQGRIVGRYEFRCESDAEATEASEAIDDPNAKELWCGTRWVCAWPPGRKSWRQNAQAGNAHRLR